MKTFHGLAGSFARGYSSESLPVDASRLGRVAHRLGALINKCFRSEFQTSIAQAIQDARGPNRTALEIIRSELGIVNPNSIARGESSIEDARFGGMNSPCRTWYASLAYGSEESNRAATPVVQPLGELQVTNPSDPSATVNIPVRSIQVLCQQPLDADTNTPAGAPQTLVTINEPLSHDKMTSPLNLTQSFFLDPTGQTVHYAGSGPPGDGKLELSSSSGIFLLGTPQIGRLLESVHTAVQATISAQVQDWPPYPYF